MNVSKENSGNKLNVITLELKCIEQLERFHQVEILETKKN